MRLSHSTRHEVERFKKWTSSTLRYQRQWVGQGEQSELYGWDLGRSWASQKLHLVHCLISKCGCCWWVCFNCGSEKWSVLYIERCSTSKRGTALTVYAELDSASVSGDMKKLTISDLRSDSIFPHNGHLCMSIVTFAEKRKHTFDLTTTNKQHMQTHVLGHFSQLTRSSSNKNSQNTT